MGVRVKVKVEVSTRSIETSALANTGYESGEPEILVPARFAEKLGLWPELPAGTRIEPYVSASGTVNLHRIQDIAVMKLQNRLSKASLVISDFEKEVILSDALLSSLGIVIEDAGGGIWRLRGERRLRRSPKPQYW